jgi:tetratricopeptide (TPR) repeat protein
VILFAGELVLCLFYLAGAQSTEQQLAALTAKARAAQEAGNVQAAAAAYEQVLRLRPGWAPAEFNLGLMYQQQKRHHEALRMFTAALQHDSTLAPARMFAGISYFNVNQYEKARTLLEQYLKLQPADREARFFLAGAYYALEQYDKAAELYLEQAGLTSDRGELYYHLAECFLALARAATKTLGEQPAGKHYLELISAQAEAQQNGGTAAEDPLKQLPCPPGLPSHASAHVAQASCLEARGDSEGATRALLKVQALARNDPQIAYWSFLLYLKLAQQALARLEQLAPGSYLLAHIRAQTFEQRGMLPEAEAEYESSIKLAQKDPVPFIEYARFKAKNNQLAAAVSLLQRAVAIDPYNTKGNALLGEVHTLSNEYTAAVAPLEVALKANPQDAQSRIYLSRCLERLNRTEEAILLLERAPSDQDGRIHYVLANYYRAQGRQAEAARALEIFKQRNKRADSKPVSPGPN